MWTVYSDRYYVKYVSVLLYFTINLLTKWSSDQGLPLKKIKNATTIIEVVRTIYNWIEFKTLYCFK